MNTETNTMSQPYFSSSIYDFCQTELTNDNSDLTLFLQPFDKAEQADWIAKVTLLQARLTELPHLSGSILLNAPTPFDEDNAEVVILYRGLIFVLRIDLNRKHYSDDSITQVHQQAYAFKNQHLISRDKFIIPVLLSTSASPSGAPIQVSEDLVANTMCDSGEHLAALIEHFANQYRADEILLEEWIQALISPNSHKK